MAPATRERRRSDEDLTAQVLGSGDPSLQEENRRNLIEQVGEDAYLADPERFWTAQQGPMPPTGNALINGPQKFLREQLPDPAVAKAAGIPAQQIPETHVLDADADPEGALHDPHGPEPGELVRLVKNYAVNRRLIDHSAEHPTGREVLTLTSSSMAEIRRAQEGEDSERDETGDGEPTTADTGD